MIARNLAVKLLYTKSPSRLFPFRLWRIVDIRRNLKYWCILLAGCSAAQDNYNRSRIIALKITQCADIPPIAMLSGMPLAHEAIDETVLGLMFDTNMLNTHTWVHSIKLQDIMLVLHLKVPCM